MYGTKRGKVAVVLVLVLLTIIGGFLVYTEGEDFLTGAAVGGSGLGIPEEMNMKNLSADLSESETSLQDFSEEQVAIQLEPLSDPFQIQQSSGGLITGQINLSDADVTFRGASNGDSASKSVLFSDVNGDGRDEIIVGAPEADVNENNGAGKVYIFYSDNLSTSIDLNNANITLNGKQENDTAGYSLAAGDFNNDGYEDLLIGTYGGGTSGKGETYLIYGRNSWPTLINLSSANATLVGINTYDFSGYTLASGDVNCDGVDDVIIGAPYAGSSPYRSGKAYVFFGRPTLSGTISLSNANVTLIGVSASDYLTRERGLTTGDFNGDGCQDLALGASYADPGGGSNQNGITYLVYGHSTWGSIFNLSNANVTINGTISEEMWEFSGTALDAGDFNNDGYDDLAIGAPGAPGGDSKGRINVIYGSPSLPRGLRLDTQSNFTINGTASNAYAGGSLALVDYNSDGYEDLLIGAYGTTANGRSSAGQTYLFYGSSSLSGTRNVSQANLTFNGVNTGDYSGYSVAGGDLEGDNFQDLLIGAYLADYGDRNDSGAAYLIRSKITCGTLSKNTTLNQDIEVDGNCFRINASNIYLDGGGYTITGSDNGTAINFSGVSNVTLLNFNINNFSKGIEVGPSSTSINLTDGVIGNSGTYAIELADGSGNVTLTNVSFDQSNVYIGTGAQMQVRWKVTIYANDTSGYPISAANITAYNASGALQQSMLTTASGTAVIPLIEYIQDNSVKDYALNYTLNFTKSLYSSLNRSINLTQTNNTLLVFTSTFECGTLLENTSFSSLTKSVSGDCFTIGAPNLNINGMGITLIGDGTGNGINISGQENTSFRNINIINFSNGLYLDGANGTHLNNSLISGSTNKEVMITDNGGTGNVLTNVTLNRSNLRVGVGGELSLRWPVNILVENNGLTIFNASVSAYSQEGLENVTFSDSSGNAQMFLIEFIQNSSGQRYLTPHTITASKLAYINATQIVNLTQTNETSLTLDIGGDLSCGNITNSITFSATTLSANLTPDQSCLNIAADDIVIDGSNSIIYGNNSGIGINFLGRNNVTVRGFTFRNLTTGITIMDSSDISLINVIANNNSLDLVSSSATYNLSDSILNDNSSRFNLSTGTSVTFVNVSFNLNSLNFSFSDETDLFVKWYADLFIHDTQGNPLNNVYVTAVSADDILDASGYTNISGQLRLLITDFSKSYLYYNSYSPHLFTFSKAGYIGNTSIVRIYDTNNTFINLTLPEISCGSVITNNITLANNLAANSTCFSSISDGVTINGNGYNLSGNGTGTGIILANKSGVQISNLGIYNFTHGLDLEHTNDTVLSNVVLRNNQYGIIFNHSNNNKLVNSIVSNNTFNAMVNNVGETNNTFLNSTLDINTVNITGTATVFWKWYARVNVTLNGDNSLPGANVTGYFDSDMSTDHSLITDNEGIALLELSEFKKNASGTYYLTPQNITASFNSSIGYSSNSTTINLTQTNNTQVNLGLNLSCTAPSDNLWIAANTNFCPGRWIISDQGGYGVITINANNVNLTCVGTVMVGDGSGDALVIRDSTNVRVSGCSFESYHAGIYSDNIYGTNLVFDNINMTSVNTGVFAREFTDNIRLTNFNINTLSGGRGVYFNRASTYSNYFLENGTFSGSMAYGFDGCNDNPTLNNLTVSNVIFSGTSLSSIGICLRGSNNSIYNSTFINNYNGIKIVSGTGNQVYYNNFNSSASYHAWSLVEGNSFNTSMNITYNSSGNMINATAAWGNLWSDYCSLNLTDENEDGYADNGTSYPYSYANGGRVSTYVIDYGPKVRECNTTTLEGARVISNNRGGGGTTPTTPPETPPEAPPAIPPGKKSAPLEDFTAEEVEKYLQAEIQSKKLDAKTTQVTVILENTGKKRMLLLPQLDQETEDPYFIVTRKTLGSQHSLSSRISGIAYSQNSIAGRLLKAEILNPEQIVLDPGEKLEKTLEIKEGLIAPRQIKIQFTTFGEVVKEQEIPIERKAVSGTAVDVDASKDLIDVYAVIVPEEISKEAQKQSQTNPLTGAAILDLPASSPNYMLEISVGKKGQSSNQFGDLYGPYKITSGKAFVFGQQFKYNPSEYNGKEVIRAKIYAGIKVVAENEFEVDLG